MGRDHRHLACGVAFVEQLECIEHRPFAHVRDVDQHAVVEHRVDRGSPELAQAHFLWLWEQHAVEPVGEEGQGRRVGGDAAPEEMRHGDVGDAALGELRHVGADRVLVVAEVKAALHRVYEHQLSRAERFRKLSG